MRKLLYNPIAQYIAAVIISLTVLFVLGGACALLGKYLSKYAAVEHSQINSSRRKGLLVSTHIRMPLACDPSLEPGEAAQAAYELGNSGETIEGAKPLTRVTRITREPQPTRGVDLGRYEGLAALTPSIQERASPPSRTVELGPVNPARLTAANRTL